MEPKFVELPEIKVVGMGTTFISSPAAKNGATVIPPLWEQFIRQIGTVKRRVGDNCFGVISGTGDAEKSRRGQLLYFASAEVSDFDSLPPGMLPRVIPAGRYAQFTHKGKLEVLEKTMEQIFAGWLPQSGCRMRAAPCLERYDKRYVPGSEESEFDILIPVS
jgi:AraC family transcriptional regulator